MHDVEKVGRQRAGMPHRKRQKSRAVLELWIVQEAALLHLYVLGLAVELPLRWRATAGATYQDRLFALAAALAAPLLV